MNLTIIIVIIESHLNADLGKLAHWFDNNYLSLNTSQSKFVLFGSNRKLQSCHDVNLVMNNACLENSDSFKYLGMKIHKNMTWNEQIDSLITKVNQRIALLKRVKPPLPWDARITLYYTLISPLFDYADVIWGDKDNTTPMGDLQILQNKAAKVILGLPGYASSTDALKSLGWPTLSQRRLVNRYMITFKYIHGLVNCDYKQITEKGTPLPEY